MISDALHTSELPDKGALIKVVQCEADKRKNVNIQAASNISPRKRASTLGVITELPQQQDQKKPTDHGGRPPLLQRSRHGASFSSSTSSLNGDTLPAIAGQIKAFGEKAERGDLKIEDRVVVHPGDPAPATSYLRDTEFRVVSDIAYLLPISASIPMKLAAMLAGRGLSIYNAVVQAKLHIQDNLVKSGETIKVLVICKDEFSMMAVQLLNHFLVSESSSYKVLIGLATLKDDGMMWYKKNMPSIKLIQWNSDAYDQDLVERTRDACRGDVDIVIGCLGLGAPLQRSFKCLKKGGVVFVTEEMNEKVMQSLVKMADQQNRMLKIVPRGTAVDDLKDLLDLTANEKIKPAFLPDDDGSLQMKVNPVEMRRKARSLSSRTPTVRE